MRAALDALRRESRPQKRETRLVQTQTRSTRFSHPIWAAFRGRRFTLIWQRNGMLYSLSGSGTDNFSRVMAQAIE